LFDLAALRLPADRQHALVRFRPYLQP